MSDYAKGDWVCEFCHRIWKGSILPKSWTWIYQSAICPECVERASSEGVSLAVVKGGAYATTPDPRSLAPSEPPEEIARRIVDESEYPYELTTSGAEILKAAIAAALRAERGER